MDSKLISDCVAEAIESNLNDRQLTMCMESMGATDLEIQQALREVHLARSWEARLARSWEGQERLA